MYIDIRAIKERAYQLSLAARTEFFHQTTTLLPLCVGDTSLVERMTATIAGRPTILWLEAWYYRALYFLSLKFPTSVLILADMYRHGGGDADKRNADGLFLNNLLTEWVATYGKWRWLSFAGIRTRLYITLTVWIFRTLGAVCFSYKHKEVSDG